jgi:sec-independent protein translocase protein TatB
LTGGGKYRKLHNSVKLFLVGQVKKKYSRDAVPGGKFYLGNLMFGIGLPELILIMGIALIVVGPEKLPEMAKSIAKGVVELKKTANSLKENFDEGLDGEDPLKLEPGDHDGGFAFKEGVHDNLEEDHAAWKRNMTERYAAEPGADGEQTVIDADTFVPESPEPDADIAAAPAPDAEAGQTEQAEQVAEVQSEESKDETAQS